MIRAEQALHQILTMSISEEPEEALMQRARGLIEQFKADSLAYHQAMNLAEDKALHVASDLEKLRDVVDHELDRRLDLDLADHVCDLLEHLSADLHAQTDSAESSEPAPDSAPASNVASNDAQRRHLMIAEAAYRLAERRQFEPGHDLEDWLAAERALQSRRSRVNQNTA
jgi:DUF2934 family protein